MGIRMKYSEDRIGALSLKIHDRLYLDEDVDYTDEDAALASIRKVMAQFFALEDKIDDIVREKISTLKRNVVPHSTEWQIMYNKYFEEELKKHRL